MRDLDLFQHALGLDEPWRASSGPSSIPSGAGLALRHFTAGGDPAPRASEASRGIPPSLPKPALAALTARPCSTLFATLLR